MIMRSLIQGGMDVYWHGQREVELKERYPVTHNPGGYYEPSQEDIKHVDFPLNVVKDGQAVKLLAPWLLLPVMPVRQYKVLVIKRDPREVTMSIAQMNKGLLTTGDWEILNNYDKYIEKGIALARNRKDVVDVCVADYQDILEFPVSFFTGLNWPVDLAKAASTIDPSKRTQRFNKPWAGDLASEIQLQTTTAEAAALSGQLPASKEVLHAVKNGAKASISMK